MGIKKIVFIAIIIVTNFINGSERHTALFDADDPVKPNIRYGGILFKTFEINSASGTLIGANGASVFNQFQIGWAGYAGLVEDYEVIHSGVYLGYLLDPGALINYSFFVLIGGAEITNNDIENHYYFIEPTAILNLNITPYMKGLVGLSYSMPSGINLNNISSSDINNWAIQFGIVFEEY